MVLKLRARGMITNIVNSLLALSRRLIIPLKQLFPYCLRLLNFVLLMMFKVCRSCQRFINAYLKDQEKNWQIVVLFLPPNVSFYSHLKYFTIKLCYIFLQINVSGLSYIQLFRTIFTCTFRPYEHERSLKNS